MKRLADENGVLAEEPEYFGEQSFLSAARARFPELESELTADPGVHLAMSVLARATMDAIKEGDHPRVRRFFAFLENVLRERKLHPEIPNAVAISYVELSELRGTEVGLVALEQMPASIRNALEAGAVR